jgi:hypothetical protein
VEVAGIASDIRHGPRPSRYIVTASKVFAPPATLAIVVGVYGGDFDKSWDTRHDGLGSRNGSK